MSSNIQTPHITAKLGDFAKTVLMPGDPLRSKLIAETFLTDAQLVNNARGVQGYTGYYQGKRVSVMASGMGVPSIGIYSYELFNFYNVENIIRIGSAGSVLDDIHVRDLVFGMSAYSDTNFGKQYFGGNLAPCCSFKLLEAAVAAARKMGIEPKVGPLYCSDAFYGPSDAGSRMKKLGVVGVEMESAALYLNAATSGKNALTICTISDHIFTGEALSAEERQNSFTQMMKVALEIA